MTKKITLKMAEKLAAFAFGPSGQVKRHEEPRNRHKRFAIYFTSLNGDKSVYVAGWGDCWEAAFRCANDNPFAKQKAEEIKTKRKEMQELVAAEEAKKAVKKSGIMDKMTTIKKGK